MVVYMPLGGTFGSIPLSILNSVFLITISIAPSTGHTAWQRAHPVHASSTITGTLLNPVKVIA